MSPLAHRVSERTKLIARHADNSSQEGDSEDFSSVFLHASNAASFCGLVAYIAICLATQLPDDQPYVCQFGGHSFSSPMSYVIIALSGIFVILLLVTFFYCLCVGLVIHALVFLPSLATFSIILATTSALLSVSFALKGYCDAIVFLSTVALFTNVLFAILSFYRRRLQRNFFSLTCPPKGNSNGFNQSSHVRCVVYASLHRVCDAGPGMCSAVPALSRATNQNICGNQRSDVPSGGALRVERTARA